MTRNFDLDDDVDTTKFTLLTNISAVVRNGDNIRLHCSAVLVEESERSSTGFMARWTIRGFRTEAAWEVFDAHLDPDKHFPFTLKPFENEMVKLLTESGAKNIFTGTTLTFNDGTEFALYAEDSERPIDVYEQTGDILKVWDVLQTKTADYWTAPYMPRLSYGPAPNSYQSQRERGI